MSNWVKLGQPGICYLEGLELKFVSYTSSLFGSFLESIEHDFIKVLQIQTDNEMLT